MWIWWHPRHSSDPTIPLSLVTRANKSIQVRAMETRNRRAKTRSRSRIWGASLVFKINTELWVLEWKVLVFHTLPLPLPLLVLLIRHSLLSPFSSTLSQEMEDSRGRTGQGQPWLVSTKRTQTTASSAKGELFFSWVFHFFPFFNWRLNLLKV